MQSVLESFCFEASFGIATDMVAGSGHPCGVARKADSAVTP